MSITPFSPRQETHKESLWRFVGLVALLVAYFLFMAWKFDAATGAWLSLLSWSFFVLCTPIADGGFIIAFPLRLLLGVRMIWTQIVVWFVAVAINVVGILVAARSSSPNLPGIGSADTPREIGVVHFQGLQRRAIEN